MTRNDLKIGGRYRLIAEMEIEFKLTGFDNVGDVILEPITEKAEELYYPDPEGGMRLFMNQFVDEFEPVDD